MEQQAAALVAGAVVQPNKVVDKGYVTHSFGQELSPCNATTHASTQFIKRHALCLKKIEKIGKYWSLQHILHTGSDKFLKNLDFIHSKY